MRHSLPGSLIPKNTILILLLLSLLSFPMVVSASPNAQRFVPWMQKRIVARDLQQPGLEVARRAPPTSHPATSTISTPSAEAPRPVSSSSQLPTSTSTFTSTSIPTPTPTPTTHPSPTPSPHTTPTPSTSTPSPVASSTTPSVVFTTSTSTHSQVPLSSTTTIQPSTSSTPTTLSTPAAVTTFGITSPLIFPTTFAQIPQTSTSAISAANASTSASPKGFFANKGAVAGVFTVLGLVVAALLVTLFIYVFKRRRTTDDDDDALFEKIPGPTSYDGSAGNRGLGALSPIYPPVTNAYADDAYAQTTNGHEGDYNYEPEQYGMQYPPRTTQQHQEAYAASRMRSTSPPSHPYASPFNSPTSNEAPVFANARASSIAYGIPHDSQDSFYGARD